MHNFWRIFLVVFLTTPIAAWLGYEYGRSAAESRDIRPDPASVPIGKNPRPADTAGDSPETTASAVTPGTAAGGRKELSLEEVLSTPGPLERWKRMILFAEQLAPENVEEAIAAAENLSHMDEDIEAVLGQFFIFAQLGNHDPASILDQMTDEGPEFVEDGFARESVYSGWSGHDPSAAAAHFSAACDEDGDYANENGNRIARTIAVNWMRTDPRAAFTWAMSLHSSDRDDAAEAIISHWVPQDPARAARAVLNTAPDDDARSSLLGDVASAWARLDHEAAMTWAQRLPDDVAGDALTVAARAYAKADLESAAELVAPMPEGENRDRVLLAVAQRWDPDQPLAALEWVRSQGGSDSAQKHATQSVVSTWASRDAFAAAQWLAGQAAGPARDGAVVGLATQVAGEDPERALQWTISISDPDIRVPQLKRHVSRWLKKDRSAATAWIEAQPGIPAELREELLSDR